LKIVRQEIGELTAHINDVRDAMVVQKIKIAGKAIPRDIYG
jgi:hypothetical protein